SSSDTKIAFSCVLTAAWHETDTGTGNLLHDKAGRSVCLNRRQPAPMGSFFVIPANAGIHGRTRPMLRPTASPPYPWIPAFAGMTKGGGEACRLHL
ncbi:MAG: hypothetical protein NDI74_15820, partial [Sphingomonas sp.]|uniref:hypothetical protein n=1 Tax=Sphingomonas sp. TaxID=28214 RepID=UPI00258B9025